MRKFVLLLLFVFACGEEDTQFAQTQITLTVQADSALRGKLDNLRATLFANEGDRWTQRSSVDVPSSKLRWPLDIPILARSEDESAQIEVIVEAYASGQRLAQARVVARFVKDRVSVASVQIYECRTPGVVCAADSCHGEGCEVCDPSGECIAVEPSTLDAATPGQDKDGGTVVDAAREDARAQAEDAATTNDAAAADSGPAPASCPANACAAPYVCITTPAGYTCRGQFADWPMPDKTPGAKTKPNYTAGPDFVTDNVTKLVWQVGAPRIVPGCTEYVQYSDGTKDDVGELCTRAQAKAYCDNLVHGSFDDWRLPTAIELSSLFDPTVESGFQIDHVAFADTAYGPYISDSIYAGGPASAWGVNFYLFSTYFSPSASGKVRCVRAGAVPAFATPAERYLVGGEQVTDQATGLVWQRTAATTTYTDKNRDAGLPLVDTACTAPWRVPTINELLTLVDYTRFKPAINPDAFPNTANEYFWGLPLDWGAGVDFESGGLDNYEDTGRVRCVQ